MATSPTLADLRVIEPHPSFNADPLRPATREDILTVLRELGGVESQSRPDDWGVDVVSVDEPGRYLIIPLEES